ncbi:MAG TPA: hypothetical protein VMT67_14875 [Terriglobales bacterium]|nr:hypothetical protein [Terriglobales bacterium]
MNKYLSIVAATLVACSFAFAQSGKNVVSHDGSCQITVPASWTVDATFGNGTSANKKVSATTSSPKMISSFDELKQNAQKVYANDKVTKSSATEFEIEGQSLNGKPNIYRGIPISGGKYCIVEVIYETGSAADARKIAETMKSAK